MDMITYVRALESSGMKRKQAEVQIQAMDAFMKENFATKTDLQSAKREVRDDIRQMESNIISRITNSIRLHLAILGVLLTLLTWVVKK